ncbi:hypothetical protein [Bradyrhizobium sp. Gha]|uniref:hypothetical protein n=1 Tax=Bradyrhizobium sp. Gha TaxID=1855318 RepID=UPI0008E6F38F|nr:hypothetical protein [Bradyrhizobium sp. Gha]SFK19448.1 hypothetical protein SAMN05216525_16121 [Bradyrhizobium sp. Gha]
MSNQRARRETALYPKCLFQLICLAAALLVETSASSKAADDFNKYVMQAVSVLKADFAGLGYDMSRAYTHEIPYGSGKVKPTSPPKTMCVAAVAEVIITAINLYVDQAKDAKPYTQLPVDGWNRMRATDIRSHIWVDPKLDSYGTADALVTFGVGRHAKFSELKPGSFINLNRTNGTGHAVVFISFLDEKGAELSSDSQPPLEKIAGFKYSQNRNSHGLGYGFAFFSNKDGKSYCPALSDGLKPDCGVQYSVGQKILNAGYMLDPKLWDSEAKDKNLRELVEGLYVQNRSRGPSFLGISPDLSLSEFGQTLEGQDTMELNPIYRNDQD